MGGFMEAYQSQQQAKLLQEQSEMQAHFAREQADDELARSQRIAEGQEVQGAETARRQRIEDKKRIERERAMMASSGVSLTVGSPQSVFEEAEITSMMNVNDIYDSALTQASETRYAGEQTRRGLLWEAEQHVYQGNAARYTGSVKALTGTIKGATQVVGMGM
jgi:hypothetical protein